MAFSAGALFGAAEELTDEQVNHIIATNLTGSIQLIRARRARRPAGRVRRPRAARATPRAVARRGGGVRLSYYAM